MYGLHRPPGEQADTSAADRAGRWRRDRRNRPGFRENLAVLPEQKHGNAQGHHQRGNIAGLLEPQVIVASISIRRRTADRRSIFFRDRQRRLHLVEYRLHQRVRAERHLEIGHDGADANTLVGDPVDRGFIHRRVPYLAVLGQGPTLRIFFRDAAVMKGDDLPESVEGRRA